MILLRLACCGFVPNASPAIYLLIFATRDLGGACAVIGIHVHYMHHVMKRCTYSWYSLNIDLVWRVQCTYMKYWHDILHRSFPCTSVCVYECVRVSACVLSVRRPPPPPVCQVSIG